MQTLIEVITNRIEHVHQLAAVLQDCADAVLLFDADGRLLSVNRAGQTLFTSDEMPLGQSLPYSAGYDGLIKLVDQARLTYASFSEEICWPDKRVFSASSTPLQDGSCCVVMHDVTRFKQQLKVKDEYIVAISHDLRNPITTIVGYSQLIKQAGTTNEAQNNFIQSIQNAAANMNELIEHMMNLATLNLDATREFKELTLSHLLWQLANEFQPQAEAKRQLLTIEKSQPNCIVRGDEMQLRLAFRNLIGNAIKYTPEGGAITLSLFHDSDLVYFAVKDSGFGIPAVDLPYVFDRFYRVRNNGHDDIQGNGLGLAIVKTIAEQHNGDVNVESEVGKGSCFTFTIPFLQTQSAQQN